MRPRILDTSAIIALFDAYPPVFDLIASAEVNEATIVLPAAAVAEANRKIRGSFGVWEPVLLTAGLTVMPLDPHVAIEIHDLVGDVATRHTVYEARLLRGVVVTCDPGVYRGHTVPLLVV